MDSIFERNLGLSGIFESGERTKGAGLTGAGVEGYYEGEIMDEGMRNLDNGKGTRNGPVLE